MHLRSGIGTACCISQPKGQEESLLPGTTLEERESHGKTLDTDRGRSRRAADRDPAVLAKMLGVWAAAALPMAALAWVVDPWLAGPVALACALLVGLTVGLIWQFVLAVLLVHREWGSVRWPVLKDALWLRAPRSPRTGRVGGRLWLVLVPCVLIFWAEEFIPSFPFVTGHDFGSFLQSDAGQAFMSGNWVWFALIAVLAVFNTVLGEELLFRGLLLPRMRGTFDRFAGSPTGSCSPSTTCTCRRWSRRPCSATPSRCRTHRGVTAAP
jgi:membrane protease YdiL (CAAX protease family)